MDNTKFQSLWVLDRLKDFHLSKVPYLQILILRLAVGLDYQFPKKTTISMDGIEKFDTDRPFLVAMNHTDRFNYMPFMKRLDELGLSPLTPWVKGKYYQNRALASLLTHCGCMPVPSRGFLLTLDWLARMNRKPTSAEYRELRVLGDGQWDGSDLSVRVAEYLKKAPGGGPEGYFPLFQSHFEGMSKELVRINRESLETGYRPLIFPQGTRSRRMSPGFSGIIQMALHLKVPILPVGVSGSDLLYPGNSPLSKGGHVHYSIGDFYDPSLEPDAPEDFIPLTIEASLRHGSKFEELTEKLMLELDALLPSEYQFETGNQTSETS